MTAELAFGFFGANGPLLGRNALGNDSAASVGPSRARIKFASNRANCEEVLGATAPSWRRLDVDRSSGRPPIEHRSATYPEGKLSGGALRRHGNCHVRAQHLSLRPMIRRRP
jgi:hypothetical protein